MSLGVHEGTVFADRYQVIRRLGAGAMGAVYEVVHLRTERRYALKVMLAHVVERPDLRERFELEAKIGARVSSEFIVNVHDAGIDEATGAPFLVMELLHGEELGQRLKRVGRLAPEEALLYLHQTALALDETHKASIVHRDLKPNNLFLTEQRGRDPRIKVLDFGVAKIVAESTMGESGTMALGTPYYMAPEQFRNGKVSAATDIYALGMVAYTLLAGEAYWVDEMKESDNLLSFALTAARGPKELASVRAARKGVALPLEFDSWFARATAPQPARRFARATAAVGALANALGLPRPATCEPPVSQEVASEPAPASAGSVREPDRDRTLRDYIGETAVPIGRRVRWLVDLARALAAAHRDNHVHGGLTPERVIIRLDGSLRTAGLRVDRRDDDTILASDSGTVPAPDSRTVPGTGALSGSRCYRAPEQLQGRPIDGRADQFTWGVIAYELLSGALPWDSGAPEQLDAEVVHATPESLRERAREVPEAVERAVLRALEKRPEDRYPTLDEAALAIEPFADAAGRAGERGAISSTILQATIPGAPAAPVKRPGTLQFRRVQLLLVLAAVLTFGAGAALLRHRPEPAAMRPSSPLKAPSSVLACPILDASGVDEPAGWLGAAAAATLCERARVLLGGSASRTLVPAELLDLPRQPVDSLPVDPYAGPEARKRSLSAAQSRAAAYVDGQVIKEASEFRVSLALVGRTGDVLGRGSGAGRSLYQATREAMDPLVGAGLVPKADVLDPVVAAWSRVRDIDGALALLDVTLAMAQNAGGLTEECARLGASKLGLGEMGPMTRWLCAATLGLPSPDVARPPADPSSPAALATRARIHHMVGGADGPEDIAEIHRLFERETTALGRSLLAATESCLLQSSDPKRAYAMAFMAVQADPKNPLGELCAPWGQLAVVSQDTASAESTARALHAWVPWDSNGWYMQALGAGDADKALTYARRAYALTPFDTRVADLLADKLLARGAREEARNIALALLLGGQPVHRLASDLLLVRVDASLARFGAALARAERAMEIAPEDAGWVRALRLEIAWRAIEIGGMVGRGASVADLVVLRFIAPDPAPLEGDFRSVSMYLPAICARASEPVSRRCFARLRSLRARLSGGILAETDSFADGAERWARGDFPGAARAWSPLLRQPGIFADVLPDAMEATFERTGDLELVERLEAAALAGSGEFNGASPAHVRAARRAAKRGDKEQARALAKKVIEAWQVADETVPAVEEMRKLLAGLASRRINR